MHCLLTPPFYCILHECTDYVCHEFCRPEYSYNWARSDHFLVQPMTRETMVVANKPKCRHAQTGDVQSEGDWTTIFLTMYSTPYYLHCLGSDCKGLKADRQRLGVKIGPMNARVRKCSALAIRFLSWYFVSCTLELLNSSLFSKIRYRAVVLYSVFGSATPASMRPSGTHHKSSCYCDWGRN